MVDSVYRTRSLGVAAEGLPDQYADGKAAKISNGVITQRFHVTFSALCIVKVSLH